MRIGAAKIPFGPVMIPPRMADAKSIDKNEQTSIFTSVFIWLFQSLQKLNYKSTENG